MPEKEPHTTVEDDLASYEALTVNVRSLMWWMIGLIIVIAVAIGVAAAMAGLLSEQNGILKPPLPAFDVRSIPSEPPVDADLQEELRELRASQRSRLNSYGWIDRDRGIVHIPIEEATQLLLQRNVPARKQQNSSNSTNGEAQP